MVDLKLYREADKTWNPIPAEHPDVFPSDCLDAYCLDRLSEILRSLLFLPMFLILKNSKLQKSWENSRTHVLPPQVPQLLVLPHWCEAETQRDVPLCSSGEWESSLQKSFIIFPKNQDILLCNRSPIITLKKSNIEQWYYVIYSRFPSSLRMMSFILVM